MKNGYSYESFTNNVLGVDQSYFITLMADAKENKVKVVK
jgi:hypothetical protein